MTTALDVKDAVPVVPKEQRISGAWIDAVLAETGSSAREVADRLEIQAVSVSRWRTGARPLSRLHWAAILCALGLSFDWRPTKSAKRRGRTPGRPRTRTL